MDESNFFFHEFFPVCLFFLIMNENRGSKLIESTVNPDRASYVTYYESLNEDTAG